jgi:hypothetical protein
MKRPDYWHRRKHMKWITVPPAFTPRTIDGKPFLAQDDEGNRVEVGSIGLHSYLMSYLVNETDIIKDERTGQLSRELKIGRGYEGNKRTRKLDRLFEKCRGGEVIGVEDADYKAVRRIIEEKSWPSATFGSQFADFEEAWMNASDKRPELHTNGAQEAEANA